MEYKFLRLQLVKRQLKHFNCKKIKTQKLGA